MGRGGVGMQPSAVSADTDQHDGDLRGINRGREETQGSPNPTNQNIANLIGCLLKLQRKGGNNSEVCFARANVCLCLCICACVRVYVCSRAPPGKPPRVEINDPRPREVTNPGPATVKRGRPIWAY